VNHLLPTTTSAEVRDANAQVAILPIGSFEQHGNHLPLITDTVIAATICEELAAVYRLFQLPPITLSCSHEHSGWAGTVSISVRTLYSVVTDIADSLADSGLSALVLVNGHGGDYVLSNIVQEANAHQPRTALFPAGPDWNDARSAAGLDSTMHEDMHAGEIETSILLRTHPELWSKE
jgi:creatinine amidohydrolase